jgi:uncharacterized protein involved in outer membrane biogenesis
MMKKGIKIVLLVIAVVLIVIVIGFFAIRAFLTPAYLRSIAIKAASEALGHPVQMGAVNLKLGWKIGIVVDDLTIPNAQGFSASPLASVRKTSLNLKLLPLLGRQVVINSADLDGMQLRVEKNTQGQMNIGLFLPKTGARGSGWTVSLHSICLHNCSVIYQDATAKSEVQVKDIRQNIRFAGKTISCAGSQTLYLLKGGSLPEMIIKIDNDIEYDSAKKNVSINNIRAAYEPIVLVASGTIEKLERLNMKAETDVPDVSKALVLIPVQSRPDALTGAVKAVASVLGTLQEPKVDGRCELKNISVKPKGFAKPLEKINGSLSFDQNSIKNILVQGQIGGSKFDVSGSVANVSKNPLLDILLKLAGDLKDLEGLTAETKTLKLAGVMNVKTAIKGAASKPSYYGDFAVSNGMVDGIGLAKPITNFQFNGTLQNEGAKINVCRGRIGNSDFALTGNISNFAKPVIQLSNTSNAIDLDELFPKSAAGQKATGGAAAPITLQGAVRISKVSGMDMEFRNVNTNITYENGIIDLKDCNADAFDGKVLFDLYYNINSPEPYRINSRMTNVAAQKVLKRFLKFDQFEARLNGVGNFQGKGFEQKQVISNMSASGNLKFTGGVFKNFPLVAGLLAWLGFKDQKNLPFNDFICSFKISNGRTQVADWALATSMGNMLTNGTIGLDGRVNLDLTFTLNKKESDALKKHHADWVLFYDKSGKAVIDMNITGKVLDPKFALDTKKIQQRLKGKIQDEWDKKKKDLEKKLKDLFKGK